MVPLTLSSQQPPPSLSPPPHKTQFKRLSPNEMAAKQEKGLCYNCEDKWNPNHRCRAYFFLLIAEDEDTPIEHLAQSPTTEPDPLPTHHKLASLPFQGHRP